MQIPATTVLVAEKIPSASQFLSRTFAKRIDHHFKDVNDLVETTLVKCSWHGKKCSGLCPKSMAGCTNRIDLVTAGPPCQAFTGRRSHTGSTLKTGKVTEHPAFSLTVDFMILFMQTYRPRGLIMEQVPGLRNADDQARGGSWCTDFQHSLAALGYTSEVFTLSMQDWIDVARDRSRELG
jgi:site-specific DNA-cytosine methylase